MNGRSLFLVWLFAIIFLAAGQPAVLQAAADEPRLEPDPRAYVFAEGFDASDWRSLFELAYWASGASGWEAAADSFNPAVEELSAEVGSMDDRARGEAVLLFMHEHFLKSYREKQSRLDTLLATGRYNCMSSAVLYSILGTAVGLEVTGVSVIDHAFCSVSIGEESIDVETTNPYGFDPGTKNEFHDGFGKTTGFVYVPPGNYRSRNSVDLLGLFSLLLQNRMADAEAAGRYSDAVGLAVDRWVLLGREEGVEFEDLIIRMLNHGALLSRAGREEEALSWAERGIKAYGPHPKWDDFIDGVVNNLLIRLLRGGEPGDARSRLDSLKSRLSAESAAAMDLMVSDAELLAALDAVKGGGSESEFLIKLNNARQNGVLSAGRIREVEVIWRIDKMNLIAVGDGWKAAWDEAGKAISELGSDPQLEKARRIYRANHKAELYNAAAAAYNSGLYVEAKTLVNEAVIVFPGESVFQNLLRNIERALPAD